MQGGGGVFLGFMELVNGPHYLGNWPHTLVNGPRAADFDVLCFQLIFV